MTHVVWDDHRYNGYGRGRYPSRGHQCIRGKEYYQDSIQRDLCRGLPVPVISRIRRNSVIYFPVDLYVSSKHAVQVTGAEKTSSYQLTVTSCRLQGGNWKPSTGNRLRYDHGNVKRAACSLHQEEQGGTAPDLLENRPVIVKVPHRKAV